MLDTLKPGLYKGNVHFLLLGPDGEVKFEDRVQNAMYLGGKQGLADQQLPSPTISKIGWMAVGTGTPSSVANLLPATDKLGAEVARVSLSPATTRGGANGNVLTLQATFPAGTGTAALTEAGLFSVTTANTVSATAPMYAATSFSTITKGINDALSITWTITVA